ncbi:hypothetical protein O1611_g8318 [Lasiodiplodia mahajangana]|uniref:Uncharacterized protein n=1 Tax=Lasiodiplodia mahajangana TaxID=1108764 RepID=A0ACC2JD09_9PEZI|nr:hypothetical protein O1611_g8318 [Lasiodiplodia mahajangana]
MHPPLIYCPRSTQFKFRIVGETECHLHPHHAPLLHIGADGDDTVLSVHPSGSGPVIESVSQIPFAAADGGRAGGTNSARPNEPTGCPASFRTLANETGHAGWNERPDQQGGYYAAKRTNSYTASGACDGRVQLSWGQGYNGSNNQASRPSNYAANPSITQNMSQPSPFYGYQTNRIHSRAPFDFQYRAESYPQYRFYPHQATPMAPFHSSSGSTPPGCVYLPVYSPNPYPKYQGGAPSISFRVGSNQTPPERMPRGGTSATHTNGNASQKSSFNPQATAFRNSPSLHQSRRNNLEQLQRSNDAAFYNLNGHGGSRSVASNDSDLNTETSSPPAYMPHAEGLSVSDTYRHRRAGEKSRSWSDPYHQQTNMSDSTPSPAVQERRSLSHHGHHQSYTTDKGKEVMQNSPSSWAQTPPPSSSVQGAASTDADNVSIKTESSVTIKQESDDEYSGIEYGANWTPVSVKTDPETEVKLHDIPLAPPASQVLDQVRSEDSESNNGNWHCDSDIRASAQTPMTSKSKAPTSARAPSQKPWPSTETPNQRSWSAGSSKDSGGPLARWL